MTVVKVLMPKVREGESCSRTAHPIMISLTPAEEILEYLEWEVVATLEVNHLHEIYFKMQEMEDSSIVDNIKEATYENRSMSVGDRFIADNALYQLNGIGYEKIRDIDDDEGNSKTIKMMDIFAKVSTVLIFITLLLFTQYLLRGSLLGDEGFWCSVIAGVIGYCYVVRYIPARN